jgi:hypothetical protein
MPAADLGGLGKRQDAGTTGPLCGSSRPEDSSRLGRELLGSHERQRESLGCAFQPFHAWCAGPSVATGAQVELSLVGVRHAHRSLLAPSP